MNNCTVVLKKISLRLFFKKRLLLLMLLIFSNNLFAILSLSVTTQMYIHGNAPEIKMSGSAKALNGIQLKLQVPNNAPLVITPGSSNEISVAYDTSPSMYSFDIDFSAMNDDDIIDVDGDYLGSSKNFKVDSVTAEWRDSKNNIISSDSTAPLGSNICNSATYKGDSTLKLTFSISAKTQYGNPAESQPKEISKTFTVKANDGICYIRPGVLAIIAKGGWSETDNWLSYGADTINRTDAYNPDQFVLHSGFKASATDSTGHHFPTTAFPEARFRIVPVNAISNYTYTLVKNPNGALISTARSSNPDSKSEFKFTDNAPAKDDQFIILVKNNQTKAQFYYRFSLNHWMYIYQQQLNWVDYNTAERLCTANNDRLPSRAELTNSFLATGVTNNENWYIPQNGYKRAIGEGLISEWGKLYPYAPNGIDNSGRDMMADITDSLKHFVAYDFYFTYELSQLKDNNGLTRRYSIGSVEGNVIVEPDSAFTMCVKY
ncbi:hypothetical protein DKK78_08670 [Gilliamella apis]|uniref:DUF1566 domain-containing protein n=2 Tax=Gilliamella apis TaxID=1970738 RepID=A0A2V4DM84_9GAMM|nr:hypothetical protein DKK78_08670 [Gilliamella apis]